MRIHLGHHFYGAGNLGDDFMIAGFLAAMREIEPGATYTCCVPFALEPLRKRFPTIEWFPCDATNRKRAIAECDVWLGAGGSPFQSGLSRWFIDHLVGDAALCAGSRKPMFYLGIGIQSCQELLVPEVSELVAQARAVWTRDPESAERLASLPIQLETLDCAADLAHLCFRETPPPPAVPGRVTLVPNFDYDGWPGCENVLTAVGGLPATERIWLAQESRELPGAERALYAGLPHEHRRRWQLISPESPGASLSTVLSRWQSGHWLVTARFHAALAGAWAGSRVVVISTNEKLRSVASGLGCPAISPDAGAAMVARALALATPNTPPADAALRAFSACEAFVRMVRRCW